MVPVNRRISRLVPSDPVFPEPPYDFDLHSYVQENFSNESSISARNKEDPKRVCQVECLDIPSYIVTNLERVKSHIPWAESYSALVQFGGRRFNAWKLKDIYNRVRTTVVNGEFQDSQDLHEILQVARNFKYHVQDNGTQRRRVKFRTPVELRDMINGIASAIEIPVSTLYQVFIVDSLRTQAGIIDSDAEVMTDSIDRLARRILKRTRIMLAMATELEMRQTDRIEELRQELREEVSL